MWQTLLKWDFFLFYLINIKGRNVLFDAILPFWRDEFFWMPLYFFAILFILLNFKQKATGILLFAAITILISDQTAGIIKEIVQRARPCNSPEWQDLMHLLVPCGRGKSFISAHATNHFAIAVYVGLLIPKINNYLKYLPMVLLIWAASIGYGQVYVGLHYPADIIAGAIIGTMIGTITAFCAKKYL